MSTRNDSLRKMSSNQQASRIVGRLRKIEQRPAKGGSDITHAGDVGTSKSRTFSPLKETKARHPPARRCTKTTPLTSSSTAALRAPTQFVVRVPNIPMSPVSEVSPQNAAGNKLSQQVPRTSVVHKEGDRKVSERFSQPVAASSGRQVKILTTVGIPSDRKSIQKQFMNHLNSDINHDKNKVKQPGDFTSYHHLTACSTRLKSCELQSGEKASKLDEMQSQSRLNSASKQMPLQVELKSEKLAVNRPNIMSLPASTSSADPQQHKNETENGKNTTEDRDDYLRKWMESFNQRSSSSESSTSHLKTSTSTDEVMLHSSCPAIPCKPPDERMASLFWRLSLGKTVTLEELDKVIMYLIKLKYRDLENRESQIVIESGHSDHPASPYPQTTLQSPNSYPEDPEPELLNDEPPLIQFDPVRSSGPSKQRASSPKEVQMSAIEKSRPANPPPQVTLEQPESLPVHPSATLPVHLEPELVDDEPPLIQFNPVRSSAPTKRRASSPKKVVPVKKAKISAIEKNSESSLHRSDLGCQENPQRADSRTIPDASGKFKCKQCGLPLLTERKFQVHMESCKNILLKLPRHRNVELSTPLDEERQEKRSCLECDEALACDKDFEVHMAASHNYCWCHQFSSGKDFQTWFREEGFHETMVLFSKRLLSKGEVRIIHKCASNKRNIEKAKECPCRMVIYYISNDNIHVTYYPFHNHTEKHVKKTRNCRTKSLPTEYGILVKPSRASDEESATPNEHKCPECDKFFTRDKDYETHMAVNHNYYWSYEFSTADEFQAWFRDEDLHEIMDLKKYRIDPDGTTNQDYHCAYNRKMDLKIGAKNACPCRVRIKQDKKSIVVKYNVVHYHVKNIIPPQKNTSVFSGKSVLVKWPRPSASLDEAICDSKCKRCDLTMFSEQELQAHMEICLLEKGARCETNCESSTPLKEDKYERKCEECGEVFTHDKNYEMHMAASHNYFFRYEFASKDEFETWLHAEGLHESMYRQSKNRDGEIYKAYYYCSYNRCKNELIDEKDRCPCQMVVCHKKEGSFVNYHVLHNHVDRVIKRRLQRIPNDDGIFMKWPRPATGDSSVPPGEEERERKCPRCPKVLLCDKDFELHMAVVHNYHWYYEFATEEEFQTWFRAEGFDETMMKKTNSQITPSRRTRHTQYFCAFNFCRNGNGEMKDAKKCPCRINVTTSANGIRVRYHVLHSHSERFVRRTYTPDCRAMIHKLIDDGASDMEILKIVKETYPPTSVNYLMGWDTLKTYRRRHFARFRKKDSESYVTRRTRAPKVNAAQSSCHIDARDAPQTLFSRGKKSENTIQPLDSSDDDDETKSEILTSESEEKASLDSDSSMNF